MSGSSTKKQQPKSTSTETPESTPKQKDGFFLKISNWLLSRLPWFKYRYESWSKTKRIIIGLVMWLIVLPIIPVVIALVMYLKDPEGFKKSKAMPIMIAVIIAWASAFGILAAQDPLVTNPESSSTAGQKTTETKAEDDTKSNTKSTANTKDDSDTAATPSEAKKKVQTQAESKPSEGRQFENCDAAFDAGVFNIAKSDPAYQDKLDRDNDGVACEK